MRETEVTVQVFEELSTARKKIEEQGYILQQMYQLNDLYYSKFDIAQLKNMSYKAILSNSFLVREILDDNPKCQLCYKNKEIDESGQVVSEEKYTVAIDNVDKAKKIFDCAHLNNWCKVNNTSYVYKNGNVEFALQHVADLGLFIEYEQDETMHGMNKYEMIEHMKLILKSLNINLGDNFSCKKVYMKFLKENNQQ